MDLLIPNSWLKKFLETNATPKEFVKYVSISGPSIEKTEKTKDGDFIYSIEITTNRVDTASVLGIAREASAILPRFGIKTKFKDLRVDDAKFKFLKKVKYLDVTIDNSLCSRFTAVLIKNVKVGESSKEIKSLLEKVGVRPINNIVDVSNFIMHELGQPVHTFDYDKIINSKMILRESLKNEKITTLDGKTFNLTGGDIVIEDGEGKLIDLCGIMGGENSAIDSSTKNILLFVQTYNQHKIRQTSMSFAQRSEAAVLFEKGLDSEMVKPAILSAIDMIEKLSEGIAKKEILDIYPKPYVIKTVSITKEKIDKIIGVGINEKDITKYMESLGFEVKQQGDTLLFFVPSWRRNDIDIPEDIVEEIARIYGYQNLPSKIMNGSLPKSNVNATFAFETNVKQILKSLGANEIYNISLVTKDMAGEKAIKLKNPLGKDTEYLRTSLKSSLVENIKNNPQEKGYIHIFELANVYIYKQDSLPEERLMLSGIIKNGNFRQNRGIVETLLDELSIDYLIKIEDGKDFLANQRLIVQSGKERIGQFGNLENGLFYYEFEINELIKSKKFIRKYHQVEKFPPQIEDLTLVIPEKTYIGNVIQSIKQVNKLISVVELRDIYKDAYTFRINYRHPAKTLTDKEVEEIRNKILKEIKNKFGGIVKD